MSNKKGTVKALKAKINTIEASFGRIEKAVDGGDSEINAVELKGHLKLLETLLPKYEEAFYELIEVTDEQIDNDRFINFQESFYQLFSKTEEMVKDLGDGVGKERVAGCQHAQDNSDIGIKTPVINIKKFDGKIEDWLRFYDNFKTIIHENRNAGSDLRKFHYLVSLLEGEAANLIDGIEITEDNYSFAWEKLVNRYKNNKILVETHISNLFELKKLESQSAKGLRDLHNNFVKNINALKKLEVKNLDDNIFLVHLITSKLDNTTLKSWEETTAHSKEMPSYEALESFLVQQYNYLDSYEKKCDKGSISRKRSVGLVANVDKNCALCKNIYHPIFKCKVFLLKTIEGRRDIVHKLKCCWQCLGSGHRVNECKGRVCSKCSGKHNYLLCNIKKEEGYTNTNCSQPNSVDPTKSTTSACTRTALVSSNTMVFPTCKVYLKSNNGQEIPGRFLLDSGSELNFIKRDLADKLGLDFQRDKMEILGIGGARAQTSGFVAVTLKSKITGYVINSNFYILKDVLRNCTLGHTLNDCIKLPDGVKRYLADPDYQLGGQNIDGILGAGVFFDIIKRSYLSPKIVTKERDFLLRTAVGLVICGNVNQKPENNNLKQCFVARRRLKEDIQCEQHFVGSVQTHSDGHFVVSLPFKLEPPALGDSFIGARKRFYNLENKLTRDPALLNKYKQFIQEYIQLGHMELIEDKEINNWPNYYLPHHAIFKESSTTSLRVVFDGSYKTTNGLSLNDILMPGPALQNDVFDILTSFRIPKYGIMADIGKMFRQIWVNKEDGDLQRILCRPSPNENLQHFRLKTVTYGTRSAPFLAIRCLHKIADDIVDQSNLIQDRNQIKNKEISDIIKTKFFMDDYLDGANTVDDLIEKQTKIESILKAHGFELRKWCSNSIDLMSLLKRDIDQHYCINLSDDDTIKALGLTWNPKTDELIVKVHAHNCDQVSKRKIMSDLHSFWDPIGLLNPVFIKGRIYLQELWQSKVTWDELLPKELSKKWINFRNQLQTINGMRIPRRVLDGDLAKIEFHGFSDASEKAYGAAVYVRAFNKSNSISSNLLCARARVAPLHKQTLPRLELQAALLLSEIMAQIKINLKLPNVVSHYWTDSEIVLAWINGGPQKWKTYVANRVSRIVELSKKNEWHHVSTKDNPADLLSRGVNPSLFNNMSLWWHGPEWLLMENPEWNGWNGNCEIHIEQKKVSYSLVSFATTVAFELIHKYSSFDRLIRITAWIVRYISNLKKKNATERKLDILTVQELNASKTLLIKVVQADQWRLFRLGKVGGA